MEIIFWLVALYFIGRRWLKKHPDKATTLKALLAQIQTKSAQPQRPATPATKRPAATSSQAAAPAQHPILKVGKKREKQFQEL